MRPAVLVVPLILVGGMVPAVPHGEPLAARGSHGALSAPGQEAKVQQAAARANAAAGRLDFGLVPPGPAAGRRLEATVTAFRGEVRIRRGAEALPVEIGTAVREGDVVETGKTGFLTLVMPDASLVSLPSVSTVRIARLRAGGDGAAIERRFELVSGRVETRVRPLDRPQARYEIATPVAVAAVRGTRFRMAYTPAELRATEETLEGRVGVSAPGAPEQLVPANFGTVATRDGGVAAPVPLLPAPVLEQPVPVQMDRTVVFRLEPLAGARRYLVEIATDAGFIDRIASLETDSPVAEFEGVPDGTLFVRASAVDARGLVGRSVVESFERRRIGAPGAGPQAGAPPGGDGRGGGDALLFRWPGLPGSGARYRFVLREDGGGTPIVDRRDLDAPELRLAGLPAGAYEWQVAIAPAGAGEGVAWLPPEKLRIGAAASPALAEARSGPEDAGPQPTPAMSPDGAAPAFPSLTSWLAMPGGDDPGPSAAGPWLASRAAMAPVPAPAGPSGFLPEPSGVAPGTGPLSVIAPVAPRPWVGPPGWGAGFPVPGARPPAPPVPGLVEVPPPAPPQGIVLPPVPDAPGLPPVPADLPGPGSPARAPAGPPPATAGPLLPGAPAPVAAPSPVVPEPGAWLLMVTGFGLLGARLRGRARGNAQGAGGSRA